LVRVEIHPLKKWRVRPAIGMEKKAILTGDRKYLKKENPEDIRQYNGKRMFHHKSP